MNFTQLEYFNRICECGSISKAAEQLFITQSALSQQLSRLEKELGVTLFNRYGNTLTITDSGKQFLESSRNILFEYQNALDAVSETKESHKLILAVTKTKSFITLSYLLPGFMQKYPGIEIQVKEVDSYEVEELLNQGEADLGFCSQSSDNNLIYHTIVNERILLAIPPEHPLSLSKAQSSVLYPPVTFEEIASEPFIIGAGGYVREFTLELFHTHNQPMHIAMETANPAFAHLLSAANVGLAFIGEISTWIAPQNIQSPLYCILEDPIEQHYMRITLAHHKRKYVTSSMRLFIDYAQEFLRQKMMH